MAEPPDIVQVLKHESTSTGGDDADADDFAAYEILDEFEDALSCAGLAFQEVGGSARDTTSLLWRDSDGYIKGKDGVHTSPTKALIGGVSIYNSVDTISKRTFIVAQNGTYTLTLPTAAEGCWYLIERQGATGVVTLAPGGGDTINGGSSVALGSNSAYIVYAEDATDWRLTCIGVAGSTESPTVPLLLNFYASSGNDYAEVTSGTYQVIGSFEYPGSDISPVSAFSAIASASSAVSSNDLRLYDLTNVNTIATINFTGPAKQVVVDSSLVSLPAASAIFEIQLRSNGAAKARAHSIQLR